MKQKLTGVSDFPIFLTIMMAAFSIRIFGAAKINFTASEAAYVMGLNQSHLYTQSLIQDFINAIASGLPVHSPLGYRLGAVIAGSFFVFMPFFMRKKIGTLTALICAFFFAIDPFLIANSISITGNTFVLVAVGFFVIGWLTENDVLLSVSLLILPILGRGLTYLFVATLATLLTTDTLSFFWGRVKSGICKLISQDNSRQGFILGALLLALLFVTVSAKLDIFVADVSHFATGLFSDFMPENMPFLYLIALFAYVPLGLFIVLVMKVSNSNLLSRNINWLMLWTMLLFLLIMFYPEHQILDLLWISIPFWIIGAPYLAEFLPDLLNLYKKNLLFIILLAIGFVNLFLAFLSLFYKIEFGLPNIGVLISVLSVIALIVVLLIYWGFLKGSKTATKGLMGVIFCFLFAYQLANVNRTVGISVNPEHELFWNGYYPDKALVDKLIQTTIANQFGTVTKIRIWVEDEIKPDVYWDYGTENIIFQIADECPNDEFRVFFTKSEDTCVSEALYLGQKFVAKSYPIWTRNPVMSLTQTDFWSWLFIRKSQPYQAYNYLWLKTEPLE